MDNLFINKSERSFERVHPTTDKGTHTTINNLESEDKITQTDETSTSSSDVSYLTQGCVSEKITSYLKELYKWNVGKGEGLPNKEVKVGERQSAKEVIDKENEIKEIVNPE